MVLNELSLEPIADCIEEARRRMQQLMQTGMRATALGIGRVLRTQQDISLVELAPGYPVVKWRNDNVVDIETRRRFRSLTTKSPFLLDVPPEEMRIANGLSDFEFEGKSAQGLGTAFLIDGLAVSLASHKQWDAKHIELTCCYVDDELQIQSKQVLATHASSEQHVVDNSATITAWLSRRVLNGQDLWNRRGQIFSNLQFCEAIQRDVSTLTPSNPVMKLVLRKLFELEAYSKSWTSGLFEPAALLNVSRESESTLSNARLRKLREFVCPDGQTRLFDWHAKLSVNQWRIHFYPDGATRRVIVGYIGPHLPTTLFQT